MSIQHTTLVAALELYVEHNKAWLMGMTDEYIRAAENVTDMVNHVDEVREAVEDAEQHLAYLNGGMTKRFRYED